MSEIDHAHCEPWMAKGFVPVVGKMFCPARIAWHGPAQTAKLFILTR